MTNTTLFLTALIVVALVCIGILIFRSVSARNHHAGLLQARADTLALVQKEHALLGQRLESTVAERNTLQGRAAELEQKILISQTELSESKESIATLTVKATQLETIQDELTKERELRDQSLRHSSALEVELATVRTAIEEQQRANDVKLAEFRKLHDSSLLQAQDSFKAISTELAAKSQRELLQQNKQMRDEERKRMQEEQKHLQQKLIDQTNPLKESVTSLNKQVQDFEKERAKQYGRLESGISVLAQEQGALIKAFKRPAVRGRYGEIQLQSLLEQAGLSERCDFTLQATQQTDEGAKRPDVVIHLPKGRNIVVDAKMPLDAFLDATEAPNETEQQQHLARHAKQVKKHIQQLAGKDYCSHVEGSPEFVVMFLPYDAVYQAALEQDPALFDYALSKNILVATPMNLVGLFHVVHMGWREDRLAQNAAEIRDRGIELHERLAIFSSHLASIGTSLNSSLTAYNRAVGTFDGRLMVTAKKLVALDAVSTKKIAKPKAIEGIARPVRTGTSKEGELVTAEGEFITSMESI